MLFATYEITHMVDITAVYCVLHTVHKCIAFHVLSMRYTNVLLFILCAVMCAFHIFTCITVG